MQWIWHFDSPLVGLVLMARRPEALRRVRGRGPRWHRRDVREARPAACLAARPVRRRRGVLRRARARARPLVAVRGSADHRRDDGRNPHRAPAQRLFRHRQRLRVQPGPDRHPAFALAGAGGGAWSLDAALGLDLTGAAWVLGALAVGIAGGAGAVFTGRRYGARSEARRAHAARAPRLSSGGGGAVGRQPERKRRAADGRVRGLNRPARRRGRGRSASS